MIVQKWTGDGIPKLNRAMDSLGKETQAHRAYRMSINRVGAKAYTQVKRALSKQVGLPQKKLIALGAIRTTKANFSELAFTIHSSGKRISLKEFNAKQFSFGVRAKPWGKTRRFEGAFINAGTPGSGKMVGNGHVFLRVSTASLPIRKMYGPSIPVEMVKDESAKAFENKAAELPRAIEQTIRNLTDGVIS